MVVLLPYLSVRGSFHAKVTYCEKAKVTKKWIKIWEKGLQDVIIQDRLRKPKLYSPVFHNCRHPSYKLAAILAGMRDRFRAYNLAANLAEYAKGAKSSAAIVLLLFLPLLFNPVLCNSNKALGTSNKVLYNRRVEAASKSPQKSPFWLLPRPIVHGF